MSCTADVVVGLFKGGTETMIEGIVRARLFGDDNNVIWVLFIFGAPSAYFRLVKTIVEAFC